MKRYKHFKTGVTLIEALFVLGIMAILIGMVMLLYSQSTSKEKDNNFIAEILQINHIVQTLYQNNPNISSLTNNIIIQSGLLESRYYNGEQIISPYGTNINTSFWYDSNGTQMFQMDLSNVPKSACIQIVSYDFTGIASDLSPNGFQGTSYTPGEFSLECKDSDNTILINMNK